MKTEDLDNIIENLKDLIDELEYESEQLQDLATIKVFDNEQCLIKIETIEDVTQKLQRIVDNCEVF